MSKNILFSLIVFTSPLLIKAQSWNKYLGNVKIKRDTYGVAHIYGKTDADAVFGMVYAQCEDDFQRIENNYIEKLGRKSEILGEKYIYSDLLNKILLDQNEAKKDYLNAKPWLKILLEAHSSALNYYLFKHKEEKPQLIKKYEPWFPLLWTDGSIGAINTDEFKPEDLSTLFGENTIKLGYKPKSEEYQQTGSNGFAISPKLSKSGHALLYINPHTTFNYRAEIHLSSENGLNSYGAVTWGQFFIYQGFNEHLGWMHTSSNADVADTYFETTKTINGKLYYKYDGTWKPCKEKTFQVNFMSNNKIESRNYKINYTKNGPILAFKNDKYYSLKEFNRTMLGLEQSWLRMKTKSYGEFEKVMNIRANTSNNTVYADKNGQIAYWHGNYMPKRNAELNWSEPQDGSISKNAYQGLHPLKEIVQAINPETGWMQNCNSTPFTLAGSYSPKKENYPAYMAPDGENYRGIHAVKLLSKTEKLGLPELIQLGYSKYLPALDDLISGFKIKSPKALKPSSQEALESLFNWNFVSDTNSIATTLAVEWAQKLSPQIRKIYINAGELDQVQNTRKFIKEVSSDSLIFALEKVVSELESNFGTWKVKWGDYNRIQRISSNDDLHSDSEPSYAVPFVSALWGALPSFNSKKYEGTKNRYGYSGNSFVCAVEFGPKIIAKSLISAGNQGKPGQKYFNSEGKAYTQGMFKSVLFYKEDVNANLLKEYRP